jgi:cell shape-determining protein MreC
VGEEVYTSNNSITFPGGIFIGKVMDIYKNASAMNYFEVLVQPEADINRLSYVYVIDYKPLINFGENI